MNRESATLLLMTFATCSVQGLRVNSLRPESPDVKSEFVAYPTGDVLEAFTLVANATMNLDQEVEMEKMMKAMLSVTKHFNAKPFIVVTTQRSGSSWLVSLLNSHPEVACFSEYFVGTHGNLRDAFEDMSASVKNKPQLKWIGFKLMMSQFGNVADLWNKKHTIESAPTFMMHWRRNVLRRLISNEANKNDKKKSGNHHVAHARNGQEAQRLASFKPKINAKWLVHSIENELYSRRAVANEIHKYRLPTCPDSHFEEWVMHPDDAKQNVFNCLQVASDALQSDLVPIHASTPVLQTVTNPEEIHKALEHSKYAYMLEEGVSDEEIYENLQKSDHMMQ